MLAAPGVPGGAVMSAVGLLGSMLGFGETAVALMIALYMAQDSFWNGVQYHRRWGDCRSG